jgi:hypothetical protein
MNRTMILRSTLSAGETSGWVTMAFKSGKKGGATRGFTASRDRRWLMRTFRSWLDIGILSLVSSVLLVVIHTLPPGRRDR